MAASGKLRAKLVWTMLFVLILVGIITLSLIVSIQYQSSKRHLASIESLILDSIVSKGKVMGENHALALKGLVADNAFTDVSELVKHSVKEDGDVVYGLFINSEKVPWAYFSPTTLNESSVIDPWSELNIPDGYIEMAKLTTRRVTLFNHEIFEVAVPVIEEGERLGVIIYGLSLSRVRSAVKEARSDSIARLKRTIGIIVGLVVLITILGIVISSRQAGKITKPLADLTLAANSLASGDMTVHVEVSSGDEIETLGATFNKMVSDLSKTYQELETLNRTLEQKVMSRTAELSSRNRDMRLVLDNINQGLITVDKDGIMAKERSAEIDRWFGGYDDGIPIVDYLARLDKNLSEWFELGFEALWEDCLPLDVCIDQLPQRLRYNSREYRFSYQPIHEEENHAISSLLVVIADMTEQIELERKEAHQREVLNVFSRVMSDRSGYLSFERETNNLVDDIASENFRDDLVMVRRAVHTLKGNSSLLGLETISSLCHEMEEEIHETNGPPSKMRIKRLERTWNELKEKTHAFTNIGDGTIEIKREDYETLLDKAYSKAPHNEILRKLVAFRLEPVEKQFSRIKEQAIGLAKRLGKGEIEVEMSHQNLRLQAEYWTPFWSGLSHVIRNAVDHGIEDSENRSSSKDGKRPTITLKAAVEHNDFVVEIGDNGKGIDWEKVERKVRIMGLSAGTRAELIEAIFSDGFSTRDEVTDTSGRGIGMAALRQCVLQMHGRIGLQSEKGKGTVWKFSFPRSQMDGEIWKRIEERVVSQENRNEPEQLVVS